MPTPPPPAAATWVAFAISKDEKLLQAASEKYKGHRVYYAVSDFVPVAGAPVHGIEAGCHAVRIESTSPIVLEHPPQVQLVVFRGVTQHLHYTNKEDKEKLVAESRTELDPSPETTAVIIPIRKSAGWWALTQDQRQAFFHKTKTNEGHTNIGRPFAGTVFRKLYHSRYIGPALPYDFVTYFEFPSNEVKEFNQLLANLRDVSKNPEWESVDLEFEVRMKKISRD